MKTKLVMMLAIFLAGGIMVNAQGGGMPRRTVEERAKAAMDKLADFKLDKDKSDQVDSIFTQSYRLQDAKRQEMMAGAHLLAELINRVNSRVHVTSKTMLGVGERRHHVVERRAADHRDVDVARRPHRALRRGPVDERNLDQRSDWG